MFVDVREIIDQSTLNGGIENVTIPITIPIARIEAVRELNLYLPECEVFTGNKWWRIAGSLEDLKAKIKAAHAEVSRQ